MFVQSLRRCEVVGELFSTMSVANQSMRATLGDREKAASDEIGPDEEKEFAVERPDPGSIDLSRYEIDPVLEKRVVRKLDWRFTPLVAWLCMESIQHLQDPNMISLALVPGQVEYWVCDGIYLCNWLMFEAMRRQLECRKISI